MVSANKRSSLLLVSWVTFFFPVWKSKIKVITDYIVIRKLLESLSHMIQIFFHFIVTEVKMKLTYKSSHFLESEDSSAKSLGNLIYVCRSMCSY